MKEPRSGAFRHLEDSRVRRARGPLWVEAVRRVRLALSRAQVEPPTIDLDVLATSLGIRRIVATPLGTHGRVTRKADGLQIEIREGLDETTRDLTIAHELAHVILGERPELMSYAEFESLCDACAEEILLPDQYIRDFMEHPEGALKALWRLHSESGLPLEFLLRRAVEAGALSKPTAFACVQGRSGLEAMSAFPTRAREQLADLEITESSSGPVRQATFSGLPASGLVRIVDGGIDRGEVNVVVLPESRAIGKEFRFLIVVQYAQNARV